VDVIGGGGMIDYSNEIFNAVAKSLRFVYPGIQVVGEYVETAARFPTVTLDEIRNVPVHMDTAVTNKYARVTYRVQVFCNTASGKRVQARKIYDSVDKILMGMGLYAKTYTTTPAIYNSEVYCITATHEGVVGADGTIYRG
jgi:hypothetical protein